MNTSNKPQKKKKFIDLVKDACEPDRLIKETGETGVIYKITNILNKKIYIGKAKSYSQQHGKIKRHGIEGRWKQHKNDARKGRDFCPYFYAAIRKHGYNNFVHEIVEIVHLDNLREREIYHIINFKSTIHTIGYNLVTDVMGGKYDNGSRIDRIRKTMLDKWKNDHEYIRKTTLANFEAVMKRAQSGKTRKKYRELNLPPNIYKSDEGYNIRVMRNGKYKITSVTGSSLTDAEKLLKAIKKKEQFEYNMENNIDDSFNKKKDHNGNDLRKGLTRVTVRGSEGYRATVMTKKGGKPKTRERTFSKRDLTMDQKLQLAIEALEEMQRDIEDTLAKKQTKKPDHNGNELPQGIRSIISRGKKGYQASHKNKSKIFVNPKYTLDENLEFAKAALEEMKKLPESELTKKKVVLPDHNGNTLPLGIRYIDSGNKGYKVTVGKKRVLITDPKYTMNEKLDWAKITLAELIEGKPLSLKKKKNLDHNGDELPKEIRYVEIKGNFGYVVKYKGKTRQITSYEYTLDQKLLLAFQALEELKNLPENEFGKKLIKKLDHNGEALPRGISKINGVSNGYRGYFKGREKNFTLKKDSMDKKLSMAKEWLLNQQNNNN